MTTPEPSTEKWSGSLLPAKRLIATPGTRCSASVTERSGSAPMSWRGDRVDDGVGVALDVLRVAQGSRECR